MEFETLVQFSIKVFVKLVRFDQELECEMNQTKYKVIIGCDMDWPP
jgi:hypothetical protein